MNTRKLAALAAIPLLWSSLALAQTASSEAPSGPAMMPSAGAQHMSVNPAEMHKRMATEGYAHHVARLAYLEAKLNLTDKQHAAWNKWKQAVLETAAKERDALLADQPSATTPPTLPEREARHEKLLGIKLQGLQAERPALQALYEVLTPEQKAILDQPHGEGHHGFGHHGFGPHGFGGHHGMME